MSERIAWMNGEFVPESEARLSIWDEGFLYGDAVFDTARTFKGKIFKLDEHLNRLYRSCRYVSLDPGVDRARLRELTLEVLERNLPQLDPDDDYWVSQRISRGVRREGFATGPVVIVECSPIPFAARASCYRDGIPLVISSVRRTPPWAFSPRAKVHNYLNVIVAEHEVQRSSPGAWALLLDEHGNIAEGRTTNFFMAKEGVLFTPEDRYVLPGISRATVIELADAAGIEVRETTIDPYDVSRADEAFLTATSMCLCGVASINGRPLRGDGFPGPITRRLLDGFSELVGLDIEAQYVRHL